jgi:ascorbate-specific PTS system EIIC-type component UlaA
MAHEHTSVTQTTSHETEQVPDGSATTTRTTRDVKSEASGGVLAARIVYYILGVIEVVLALRFLLALLGANRANGFADLVFNISYPFAAPFFGLFSYTPTYGNSQFEMSTLVAMLVYALVAWGIVKLIRLPRAAAADDV